MGIKFSELLTAALDKEDILAIVDDEAGNLNSRKITGGDVASFIYSQNIIHDNLSNLITVLNSGTTQAENKPNNLRASTLFYDANDGAGGSYRSAGYFLNWNNIQSKPVVPLNNSQLGNDFNFISIATDDEGGPPLLRLQNTVLGGASPNLVGVITTDQIQEGNTNRYFNDTSVRTKVEEQFPDLFNQYSATFDSGNSRDSLQNVRGLWTQITANTSNKVLVFPASQTNGTGEGPDRTTVVPEDYKPGQVIRVYGCEVNAVNNISQTPSATMGISNVAGFFTDPQQNNNQNTVTFNYILAYFDLVNGRIGSRSEIFSTPTFTLQGDADTTDILRGFSIDRFISVPVGTLPQGKGMIIYRNRSVDASSSNFRLVAVLGPKDLATGVWRDYHTFDFTDWSGKDSEDNSYYSGQQSELIHFPASIDGSTGANDDEELRGWSDLTIAENGVTLINNATGTFQIEFNETVSVNTTDSILASACSLTHNDTVNINEAIIDKSDVGIKSLQLNAKTYITSHISLPDRFGLQGIIGITKVKKLPWGSFTLPDDNGSPHQPLIRVAGGASVTSSSLENVDFDGNSLNQFLLSDDAGNRFIDFGLQSTDVTIHNCKIQNIIGEGIYASLPLRFKMNLSEISNSGLTDRHDYSPLVIDSGENTLVTGNVIQNFTESIDATVNAEGIISNNVIKNVGAGLNIDTLTTDGRPGSGLDIYGSTFLVTSGNVIMGPANETLSTPDILNSEFDSINIRRSQMQNLAPTESFTSDPFVYQENGFTLDLTEDSMGLTPKVEFRVNLLSVDSENNHTFYGNTMGPGNKDISGTLFQAVDSTNGATVAGSYLELNKDYVIVNAGDTDWTDYGAMVNKNGAMFRWNGVEILNTVNTTGIVTSGEFVGYNDTDPKGAVASPPTVYNYDGNQGNTTKTAYLKSITTDIDPTDGGFQFEIDHDDGSTLLNLTTGAFEPAKLIEMYNSQRDEGLHPANTKHYGVAWSANLKRNVLAGDIAGETASWTLGTLDSNGHSSGKNVNGTNFVDTTNANRNFADFQFDVLNLKYLSVGDYVQIHSRGGGFSIPDSVYSPTTNPFNGFINSIGPEGVSGIRTVTIRYYYPSDLTLAADAFVVGGAVGERGTLNIIDNFVMAQGLIK